MASIAEANFTVPISIKLICPDCKTKPVKTNIQCEDGSGWYVCWLCECKPINAEPAFWDDK